MKLLTPEEIAKLKESPYVVEATERYVYFNIEFKKKYYRAYQRGVKPTQILIDLGLDPQLLGTSRIYSIRTHVLKQAKGGRFTDKSDSAYRKAMKFLTPKERSPPENGRTGISCPSWITVTRCSRAAGQQSPIPRQVSTRWEPEP